MDNTMLTLRYARDKTRYTLRQAQQQSPSNLADESTTAGDLPTKEGVSGILASGRRRLALARSAELLSLLWLLAALSGGLLAGWLALPRPSSRGIAPWDKLQQR